MVGERSDYRPDSTVDHDTGWRSPLDAAKGTAARAGFNTIAVADQKSASTQVAAVVQAKAFKKFELFCGGVKGNAIGPCNSHTGQMSGLYAQHMLRTLPGSEIEMHLPRCARNGRLSPKLGSSGSGQPQIGSHAQFLGSSTFAGLRGG